MKKIKLERFHKQMRKNLPLFLSIFGLSLSIFSASLSIITSIRTQHALHVTESWRDALSRSSEIVSEDGKAYPIRKGEKWGVSFQPGRPSIQVITSISSTITFMKGNTTLELVGD